MNNLEKIILYSLLVITVILGVVNLKSNSLGAYIDSGQVSRFTDVNITNDLVVDGLATITGATSFTGTPTFGGSSSTIVISGTTDKTGCIKIGDSRGSAYIPVYLTIASSTVSATTTKPAICK